MEEVEGKETRRVTSSFIGWHKVKEKKFPGSCCYCYYCCDYVVPAAVAVSGITATVIVLLAAVLSATPAAATAVLTADVITVVTYDTAADAAAVTLTLL